MIKNILILLTLSVFTFAQIPSTKSLQGSATDAAKSTAGDAQKAGELAAAKVLLKKAKNIPFALASSELKLNDPSYAVGGINLDKFIKTVLIPVLAEIVNKLPTGTKLQVVGHANSAGADDATDSFIGNNALSKERANAVLTFLRNNSQLDMSKFEVIAKSSSQPASGLSASDNKNCRVSFDIN